MNDDLDERTKSRIRRLANGAPVLSTDFSRLGRKPMPTQHRSQLVTAIPAGFVGVLAVSAVFAFALLGRGGGSGQGSPATSLPPTVATTTGAAPTASPSPTATVLVTADTGLRVTELEAHWWPSGKYMTITATITNASQSSVKLVGVKSSIAGLAGIYATTDCASPDSGNELCGKQVMPFWRIDPGESVHLRSGAGEIILGEFTTAVESGESIKLSLEFDGRPAVDLTVVIA
jgi:copper(I)-binding protein